MFFQPRAVSCPGACVFFSSGDVMSSCCKKEKVKPGIMSFQVSFLSCFNLLFTILLWRQQFSKFLDVESSTGTFKL